MNRTIQSTVAEINSSPLTNLGEHLTNSVIAPTPSYHSFSQNDHECIFYQINYKWIECLVLVLLRHKQICNVVHVIKELGIWL